MRSECIDQLEKWYGLMEGGAISSETYKELQETILKDIKKHVDVTENIAKLVY